MMKTITKVRGGLVSLGFAVANALITTDYLSTSKHEEFLLIKVSEDALK